MIKKILLLLIISFTTQANTLLQQRWQFKDAHKDILNGKSLSIAVSSYPIAHYLRYFYLKLHLTETIAIQQFLTEYNDSPLENPLRQSWLRHLAKKKDWQTFISAYSPQKNTILQCYFLKALLKTQNNLDGFTKQAIDLWLVGKSQAKECNPIFKYLYAHQLITTEMRWQRIRLAMGKGNIKIARFIANGLSDSDRETVTLWYLMHQNPAKILKKSKTPAFILRDGIKRLARKNVKKAYKYWKKYKIQFSSQENAELWYDIALRSVTQNHPQAAQWLDAVSENLVDNQVKQAKLQVALSQKNWEKVKKLTYSQDTIQWQYWHARALEQMQEPKNAEKLFQKVSRNRDYYGFLSADRLGIPYQFPSSPLEFNKTQQKTLLQKYAGLVRARELYFIGQAALARLEWQFVLPKLNTEELKIAASLAHKWGWHDRAIISLAAAKYWDELEIRFPAPFYDIVHTHAHEKQLDAAYVYAIMRQESGYQSDIRSSTGALGLMQLMPATAKQLARKQKISLRKLNLIIPNINVNLGTAYLKKLLKRFNNNHILATAAYNAGPTRVKRWLKKYGCHEQDIWIELIPFSQTRKYVKHVLSYTPILEFMMVKHQQVTPMRLDVIKTGKCSH